jgi:hypothetical protein
VSPLELCGGLAAVLYLPSLEREQVKAVLAALHRPRGVAAPSNWRIDAPESSVHRT